MALLKTEKLSKVWGETIAVDQLDFSLDPGECVAILGANGAGKTTAVEMMEGLVEPTSGELSVFGDSYQKNRNDILARVGVMLQETNLYKRMTVRETIELFASFYPTTTAIDQIFKDFHLTEIEYKQLRHLSGGQKQRVFLACSMVNSPKILFLDEPTTGLDPRARRFLWQLIKNHKAKDNGIVLTTHYMEEAQVLADRVLLLAKGVVFASGKPADLIRDQIGEVVLSVHTPNQNADLRQQLQSLAPTNATRGEGNEVDIFCSSSDEAWNLQVKIRDSALASSQFDLTIRSANLEDVFLKSTGRGLSDAE